MKVRGAPAVLVVVLVACGGAAPPAPATGANESATAESASRSSAKAAAGPPTGKLLLGVSEDGPRTRAYVIPLGGIPYAEPPPPVREWDDHVWFATFRADGARIAYIRGTPPDEAEVHVMAADGSGDGFARRWGLPMGFTIGADDRWYIGWDRTVSTFAANGEATEWPGRAHDTCGGENVAVGSSPDRKKLVVHCGSSVYRVALDAKGLGDAIAFDASIGEIGGAIPSDDGARWLVWTQADDGTLFTTKGDGSSPQRVAAGITQSFVMTGDGRYAIAATMLDDGFHVRAYDLSKPDPSPRDVVSAALAPLVFLDWAP